ncbi:MAG: hypothetical protein WCO55_01380 [Candidatus Falkowbacteria bacterium]
MKKLFVFFCLCTLVILSACSTEKKDKVDLNVRLKAVNNGSIIILPIADKLTNHMLVGDKILLEASKPTSILETDMVWRLSTFGMVYTSDTVINFENPMGSAIPTYYRWVIIDSIAQR